MSILVKSTALAFSFLTLSSIASAGDPGPEGVPVDISNIVLYPDKEGATATAAKAATDTATTVAAASGVVDGAGNAIGAGTLGTTASAAAGASAGDAVTKAGSEAAEMIGVMFEKGKDVAGNVMEALTPAGTVPALTNDRFELYLSDKVAFGMYERNASERFESIDEGRLHLGLLYGEARDTVFQGGLAVDTSLTDLFRLSVGGRGYVGLLGDENEDTIAAALGAEAAYILPFEKLPLEFGASIYYAPDILTFGTSDRVIDTRFGVALPVRPQLSVFTGARFLQFDTRPGDEEVDNRIHLGVRWDFKEDSGS